MKAVTDILDTPILALSESDHLDLRALCEGTLITGAPGTGKSSGRQLAYGLLRVPRMGGLVVTAKATPCSKGQVRGIQSRALRTQKGML
jgi:hypothetical protein